MSPLAFYRSLIANGVPEATAFAMAEKFEADREAEVRATYEALLVKLAAPSDAAAERRRAWDRQRKAKTSGGIPVESGGTPPDPVEAPPRTGAPVVNTSSSSLRSEEIGGGGGVVGREREADDWPEGKASDHADQLVAHVASPWLDPNKSPDLVTTRGRIAAWRRDGASWEHDVLPVVTGLCANRRSRIASWKFFDDAIARSIAENRAALEIPEATPRPHGQGPPMALTTQIAAEHAEARRRVLES